MGTCVGREVLAEAPWRDLTPSEKYCDYSGAGPWSTWDATAVMPPRLSRQGPASIPPATLMDLLTRAAQLNGDKDALMVERPLPPLGEDGKTVPPALPLEEWTKWTYTQYLAEVRAAARGFVKLGFKQYDSVNVWGFNSPEWFMACIAAGFAGGKVAGIYPTDSLDTVAYKVLHSGGSIIVIESKKQLEALVAGINARGDVKRVKAIVAYSFEPAQGERVTLVGSGSVPLLSWKVLIELDKSAEGDKEIESRTAATKPGNCACLIYTSGTTGEPKAVMISHDNIVYEAGAVNSCLQKSVGFGTGGQERCLSYLPLSHVAGMMVDIASPLSLASSTAASWYTVFFARSYDLKAGSVKDRLQAARPTLFLGVPLVWEKIADRIRAIGAEVTGVKKQIAEWAKGLGLEYARNCQLGGSGSAPIGYGIAETLVLSKVKANLGLDQCKFGLTGAAPIRTDTLEYFGSLGLSIKEAYGMSECTAACTISLEEAHAWGSCGWELPGTEVRAFAVGPDPNVKTLCPDAPDLECQDEKHQGELCFRGRSVMMGYMANPDLGPQHVEDIKKKNAEAIDKDGWLHSGDKGMITAAGLVKITGRYKELIIGEGGENIAPVPIEDRVKKSCDGICEVMMIGDKQKYNVALVTLKAVGANGEVAGTDQLDAGAKRLVEGITTISAAMKDPKWIAAVQAAIMSANNDPKCCRNAASKIQKFTILPTNFSEEQGELTPTKKLKRAVVEKHFQGIIEKMYSTDGVYVPYS